MSSAPPSQPKESFYLIPIGETGTGKTTLINSFANYSRYATLDEAIENGPVVLADVGFTYSAAGVRGKSVYLRGSSSDVNKEVVDVSGMTHTQGSSVYSIDFNDSEDLIFYDYPGFGSQSLLQGEKPDETRLHTELRTFVKSEGKPLVKNIVYCFINTRAHSFKPAATLTTLRDFLLDLEGAVGVEFPTKKENIFCFENDCFRYLCYLAANPGDQSRHHEVYVRGWTTNVKEYKRLISHVKTLTPILHEVVKTQVIAMEPTDFRGLLPDPRRAVIDLLIELEKWPMLKEFISAESQEVQQAFEVFMKSVDTRGDHASIQSPQVLSEETSRVELLTCAMELVQLEVVNETDDAKKADTKDDSKFNFSNLKDLHIAVRQGDEKLAQSLIDKGVDINGKKGEFNFTPLHSAAQNGHVGMVKFLFQHGATIDSEDKDLYTPLHIAVLLRHNLVVEMLITAGASVSSKGKDGWTPLHFAAGHNHIESARTLLKHHAPIDAKTVIGRTPLHVAARNGHVDMVNFLLQHGANIGSRDNHLCSPLYLAAQYGHDQVVVVLLGAGASVSSKNKDGWTPLHLAAGENRIESVRTLLKYHAWINAVTVIGSTPLHLAVLSGHELMVKFLLDENANLNACDYDGQTPLHIACSKGMTNVVNLLLQYKATIEVTDKKGVSPLQLACREGAINCVVYLLERGANPNWTYKDGPNALYFATYSNHADVVKMLIQYGANVNACCNALMPALHLASRTGNVDIVTLLLQTGANPNSLWCLYNKTPLQLARANGHNEIAAILVKYGAR